MIISISGKAGSGKDTVGKIIQHLTSEWQDDEFKDSDMLSLRSDWQIKKYSDKLKDIVCILIGCTRDQLEDQEFKKTPLGKEWTKWGIVRPNETRVIDIQSSYEKAFERKETVWQDGSTIKEIQLTPRMILQLIGTEGGRNLLHPDIWVNALYSEYKQKWIPSGDSVAEEDVSLIPEYPNWIITDSRFPNDVIRTREMGGILIRVNRAECEGRENEHFSETALDNYTDWDHVIENNGAIEDLIESVKNILIKEGILNGKGIL